MQKRFDKELARLLGSQFADLGRVPRILVAVSGGVDSISLANLFLSTNSPLEFAIAHCNFALRGEASDADEQFVTFWALNRGITLYKTTFDTTGYAAEHHLSTEMAARELRYDFFAKTAFEEGYDAVAVGHNSNDNAETLLLNLVRGTGLQGLGGMKQVAVSEQGIPVLRPLLWATRKQIEAYAETQGLFHCEDATNAEPIYKRNKIRLEVLPLLEEINPSVVKTLSGEAQVLASASDFASYAARNIARQLTSKTLISGVEYDEISLARLLKVPGWEYLLYNCLSENYGFNSATVLSLIELIRQRAQVTFSGKEFSSDEYTLVTGSEALLVGRKSNAESLNQDLQIPGPGEYTFSGRTFKVSVAAIGSVDMQKVKRSEIYALDGAKLSFPLTVRGYREGDRMRPFGLKGSKKLSDVFADLKWTAPQKEAAVLLTSEAGDIALLWDYRISRDYRLGPDSKAAIIIS